MSTSFLLRCRRPFLFLCAGLVMLVAVATIAVLLLLQNIAVRQQEARQVVF